MNLMKSAFIYFSIGDWGAKLHDQYFMKKVAYAISNYYKFNNPQFIIALGDNFYDKGVKNVDDPVWDDVWYNNFIKPYPQLKDFKWYSILGNHDYYGGMDSVNAQIDKTNSCKNWHMPNNQYSYYEPHYNSYHIFIDTCKIYPELYVDTNKLFKEKDIFDSLQYLENHLIRANKLKCNWICVYGHYHIYSNGYYTNYDKMITRLVPLFKKYNVNIYFSGHEHNFQVLKEGNIHYIINGAGAYSSSVHLNNENRNVELIHYSTSNGFCIHSINKYYNLKFINTNNECEHNIFITN